MTQSQRNAVVLKKSNEVKFNQLWATFAKSEVNAMRFSEFMQFIIDRCLITNKITIGQFYELFLSATGKRASHEPAPTNLASSVIPVHEKTIQRFEFRFLLNELGKYVYHNDKNQQDRVYNDLLSEKSLAQQDYMHYSRVMTMDETNRKLLMENSIQTLANYEEQLKNIYLLYVQENYWSMKKQGRILLTHREIELQNKKMSSISFIRFLKEAEVLPHLINVEHVEDILSRVVPGTNPKENEFYYRHFLVDCYSKELDNPELRSEGDPGLLFFEFMFSMARISLQISKEVDNAKKVSDYIITKFLNGYLQLRSNEDIKKQSLPVSNKPYMVNLKTYYSLSDQLSKDSNHKEEQQENLFETLRQQQQEMDVLPPLQFNIPNMLKVLNNQLAPLPPEIVVVQELPPPFDKKFKDVPKLTIGQQPPPQKVDKNKPTQKPSSKKTQLKKGEKPPRVFQFMKADEQTMKVESSEDYFQKLATELDYSLKPISSLQRGNIPLDPFPSLISEILYPPEVPENVLPFIEAGLNAHNESAYALALENYKKAYTLWKEDAQLSVNIELYFEFTRGGVYLSAGKDDYAFNCFYNCRSFNEKIPYLSPDRALPYCGLGEALYNAEEYELAARAYLKARQIREPLLGVQSVDTATVFNNIGCCFFMLDRPKQAMSYLKIGKQVLVSELGQFHQRSQTIRENIHLCNTSFFVNTPEYRKLWQIYEKDPFGKKKKKKKKDGKKK